MMRHEALVAPTLNLAHECLHLVTHTAILKSTFRKTTNRTTHLRPANIMLTNWKCLYSKDTCKDEGHLQIIKHTKILHLTNRNYELDKHQNHLQDSVRLWPLAVFGPWTANRFAAIGVPLQSIGSSLKARRSVQTNRSKNLYSIFPIIITPTPFVMNWPARCNDFLMSTTKYAPVQIL